MVFGRVKARAGHHIGLLLIVALLLLVGCNSDDSPGTAANGGSNGTVESDDTDTTESPEDNESDESEDSEGDAQDDEGDSEDDATVEGATAQQQERIDSGKPTLLIRAPESGARVQSPMKMRFEVLNGEIVENSADEDGYVIFVTLGKSSSLIPIYDNEGEVRFSKNGSTKVTAMLGGQRGAIKKSAVTITVRVTGVSGGDNASGGSSS